MKSLKKNSIKNNKDLKEEQIKFLKRILSDLNKGKDIAIELNPEEFKLLKELGLISIKPRIIVCNVNEDDLNEIIIRNL